MTLGTAIAVIETLTKRVQDLDKRVRALEATLQAWQARPALSVGVTYTDAVGKVLTQPRPSGTQGEHPGKMML